MELAKLEDSSGLTGAERERASKQKEMRTSMFTAALLQ